MDLNEIFKLVAKKLKEHADFLNGYTGGNISIRTRKCFSDRVGMLFILEKVFLDVAIDIYEPVTTDPPREIELTKEQVFGVAAQKILYLMQPINHLI